MRLLRPLGSERAAPVEAARSLLDPHEKEMKEKRPGFRQLVQTSSKAPAVPQKPSQIPHAEPCALKPELPEPFRHALARILRYWHQNSETFREARMDRKLASLERPYHGASVHSLWGSEAHHEMWVWILGFAETPRKTQEFMTKKLQE